MKRKRYYLAVVVAALLASLPGLADGASVASVSAIDFAFRGSDGSQPAALKIGVGQSVDFQQAGSFPHNVHFDGTQLPHDCTDNATNPPIIGPTVTSSAAPGNANAQASGWSGTCTFTQAGTYSFHCTVHGFTGTITVIGPDEAPTAAYTPNTHTTPVGQTVAFDGTASTDPDGTIVAYRWVWGDGTPDGSGPTPTHVFTLPGLHSVGLFVTDSDGQTAAVGHGITVVDDVPTAAFTPSTFRPAVGQTVTFTGSATDSDGTIVSYRWVWGDGTPDGSGATATHAFTAPGLRSVGLFVTDTDGQTSAVGHGITTLAGG